MSDFPKTGDFPNQEKATNKETLHGFPAPNCDSSTQADSTSETPRTHDIMKQVDLAVAAPKRELMHSHRDEAARMVEDMERDLAQAIKERDEARACRDLRATEVVIAQQQLATATEALETISKQLLNDEMDDHSAENADWWSGYESIVKIARKALAKIKENSPDQGA